MKVVNLYSRRLTDPAGLHQGVGATGPHCMRWIRSALREGVHPVICGWGASKQAEPGRVQHVLALIRAAGQVPMCLGMTKDGAPRHPLYLKRDAPLIRLTEGK